MTRYLDKIRPESNYINWNGFAEDGRSDDFIWGDNNYYWSDVQLALEIREGLISTRRSIREQQEWLQEWRKNNPEKTKQLVHLICRVKGEKVFDESKEVDMKDTNITLEDVDLVTRRVLGNKEVSIICEIDGEEFKQTKLVEEYEE
tara:strand:- start:1019 stop:1456 length:438 start_codon:yes stop_codon:yes gene_type:complete